MPGLNRQGPEGQGPMTGKRQGMCRRTDDLPVQDDRFFMGRGMGGRCRGFASQSSRNQYRYGGRTMGQGFSSGEAEELTSLKEEYQKTQEALSTLLKKIEGLESGNQ